MYSVTVPSSPFGFSLKFSSRSYSPIVNSRSLLLYLFWIADRSACQKPFHRDHGALNLTLPLIDDLENNSAGVWPVVLFGFVLLQNKNRSYLCLNVASLHFKKIA